MRIRRALLLSDVHLGWSPCSRQHQELLERLPEAVDDAELIVLNGDIIDAHRGLPRGVEAELVARLADLVGMWRAEGRTVVYIEGNHDAAMKGAPLNPDRWVYDWEGASGERVRVLHGHRFGEAAFRPGAYEEYGRHIIRAENFLYAHSAPVRAIYQLGFGHVVGAIGLTEDIFWTRAFPGRVTRLMPEADVLVHGHFHFGRAHRVIATKAVWRSGSWVSQGHVGSVDRMLRYRDGQFERIGLEGRRFRAIKDGL
ncbi:MAG TPA: metallophosphoesterase [Polyangiaceae bacterium]|nr:metallophosphoesterase [Polyangiaceae bacterium]